MKTTREIQYATVGGLPFIIPAGAKVNRIPQDKMYGRRPDQCYWVDPSTFPRDSIERHDATYYGVSVLASDVDTTNA